MSELITKQPNEANIRRVFLAGVSAAVLTVAVNSAVRAEAAENTPTFWIELGGQLHRIEGQGNPFPVGFVSTIPDSPVYHPSPLEAEQPIPLTFSEEGNISFRPKESDWAFSVAIRYGRSNNTKNVTHQTNRTQRPVNIYGSTIGITDVERFADSKVQNQESHTIVDFAVGKDVGLGIFGRDGSSMLSVGVRFAQFEDKKAVDIRARPDMQYKYFTYGLAHEAFPRFHTYHITGHASRSFHGVGPSLSWAGALPLIDNGDSRGLSLDFGANVALLFGKQKADIRHHDIGRYFKEEGHLFGIPYQTVYDIFGGHNASRSVIVPNAGGFAGATYRIKNFKISAGYRADFFVGAVDGGIDTRKSETLGFYGPFATVSIGLGG